MDSDWHRHQSCVVWHCYPRKTRCWTVGEGLQGYVQQEWCKVDLVPSTTKNCGEGNLDLRAKYGIMFQVYCTVGKSLFSSEKYFQLRGVFAFGSLLAKATLQWTFWFGILQFLYQRYLAWVRLFDLRTSGTLAAILSLDLRGKGKEKFSFPSSTLSWKERGDQISNLLTSK